MEFKHQNLKVIAQRDPEAHHIWVAQTLRGGLVGQGATLKDALEDLKDAVLTMLYLTLGRGDEAPTFTPSAPEEDHQLFEAVVADGNPVEGGITPEFLADADRKVGVLATWIQAVYVKSGSAVADRRTEVLSSMAFEKAPAGRCADQMAY